MKALLFSLLTTFSLSSMAGIEQAPPAFKVKDKRAVWIDIQKADYTLRYNVKNEQAFAQTTFTFKQLEKGYPLFDLVNKPISVSVNGEDSKQKLVKVPGNVSSMRMVQTELAPGEHTMTITSIIEKGVRFKNERRNWGNVSSAFWIRDLKDRMFLERYLPTNYEYDQYQMNMDVKVTGTKRWHSFFANGQVTKINENHYKVAFPDFYTSSSVFFHLIPINKFVRWYLEYPSISGKKIPVTIYSSYRFYNHYLKRKAWAVLKELEADYGAWPHPSLIIYGTGIRGGMEYAGATETSLVALGHELQHAYFAKAIHPANGNSGWLDEAIASWRDKGHQTHERPFYNSVNLGAHNVYTRKTDKRSYEYGRSFMAYLDHLLKQNGKPGLKDFLRIYFHKRKFTTVTTEMFKSDLEEYAQMSFQEDFFQYIYGGNNKFNTHKGHDHDHDHNYTKENPYHPTITEAELDSIL